MNALWLLPPWAGSTGGRGESNRRTKTNQTWQKILVVNAGDFLHKYSSTLVLLGSAQHPTCTHPKFLGQYYDNVYHQERLISDLLACGKTPTKEQTRKIYNQEYEEVLAQIENTLNLSLQSLSYPMVPTSLLNPDIILPQRHTGNDKISQENLLYSQYPYQEADDYDSEEEDMEVEDQAPGNAGGAHAAAPTGTRCPYCHPEASYALFTEQPLASPQSIHIDMDVAMEFDNLKVAPREAPPQGLVRELYALDLVNCLMQGMANTAPELLEKFTWPPPVSAAADATLRERFQQRRAMIPQPPTIKSAATGRVLAFDQLEHWKQSPLKEEPWMVCPEMMPRKVGRGWQLGRGQEYSG